MSPDGLGAAETDEVQGRSTFDASGWPAVQDSSSSSSGISRSLRRLPPDESGGTRRRGGSELKGHAAGRRGSTDARAGRNTRICPESHESVDGQRCEECEKYRRWPEGTTEEHRECWYDWQIKPPINSADGDDTAE